jgi:hypothetical protein
VSDLEVKDRAIEEVGCIEKPYRPAGCEGKDREEGGESGKGVREERGRV